MEISQYPKPITVCFVYFRSLTLINFGAALYALSRQDLNNVAEILVVDNDTEDTAQDIQRVIDSFHFSIPVRLHSEKHGDRTRTQSWSTNTAVRLSTTPWVLFTRADYLLDFDLVTKFTERARHLPDTWRGFITSWFYHLHVSVEACNERAEWRTEGPGVLSALPGVAEHYSAIDAGVWMTRRELFEAAGGFDERLTLWGHAQTLFQHQLAALGVEFVVIPKVLFYHPQHGAMRDLDAAHAELHAIGRDVKELWVRYEGAQPYK